jgi:sugar phosphate isomerase/epimerase
MRYGIMAMQINSLIPPEAQAMPPEQVLARVMGLDHSGMVRGLAEQGFDVIELNGDLAMLLPHTFSPDALDGLAELKAELGLNYTLHLPLWSVEPSTLNAPVRYGSVRSLVDSIQTTLPLEPEVYVLHATGALAAEFYRMRLPEAARAVLLRQFQNSARESIQAIMGETGIPSRKLAIETIEFPFDLTLELAEELDLSICFDTGHVLSGFSGPVDFFEALERCLPRLGEVHLHDSPNLVSAGRIEYGLDHQPLGTGELELARFLNRLDQVDFPGPVIFELQLAEALASMEVIREYYRPRTVGLERK